MNIDTPDDDPIIRFYDIDYPLLDSQAVEEGNVEPGRLEDIKAYVKASETNKGPILELCCGSGRMGIALAQAGHQVMGVDISTGLLNRYRERVSLLDEKVQERIEIYEDDARTVQLDQKASMVIIPFNSLNCIGEASSQLDVLKAAAAHLEVGGKLVLDIANPYTYNLQGRPSVEPLLRRKLPDNQGYYIRFIAASAVDTDQRQRIYGWYDVVDKDHIVRRYPYSIGWRLIFKPELQMMLALAGFHIRSIHGSFQGDPYTIYSDKMFVFATKFNG
jgi:SAM-dependent methyltransferase